MKENKLASMVDYILNHPATFDYEYCTGNFLKYASFLNTPLKLGMFVPTDKDGNVLSDPELTMCQGDGQVYYSAEDEDFEEFQQAEENVLFEGFKNIDYRSNNIYFDYTDDISICYIKAIQKFEINDSMILNTVEDLINNKFNLTLTSNAIKKYMI